MPCRTGTGWLLGRSLWSRATAALSAHSGGEPDAEIEESDAAIPNLPKRRDQWQAALALNDDGDEVILLDPRCGWRMRWRIGKGSTPRWGWRKPAPPRSELAACPVSATPRPPMSGCASWPGRRSRSTCALPAARTGERPALGDGLIAPVGDAGREQQFHAGGRCAAALPGRGGIRRWSGLRRGRRSGDGSRRRCDRRRAGADHQRARLAVGQFRWRGPWSTG